MMAYQVAKELDIQPSISPHITHAEFEVFHNFWKKWMIQPVPTNWANAQGLLKLSEGKQSLDELFQDYQTLQHISTGKKLEMPENIDTLRGRFMFNCWNVAIVFSYLCERDLISKAITSLAIYKPYYQNFIHPHFLIFQRFVNFLYAMLEKEKVDALRHPLGVIPILQHGGLGFLNDRNGYLPIPLCFNPQSVELNFIHYGADALTSQARIGQRKAILVDHGEIVIRSCFLVDLQKTSGKVVVSARRFYGVDSSFPFSTYEETMPADLDALDMKNKILLAGIQEDVEAFKKNASNLHEVFIIPLPHSEMERKEFAYCFLLDLVARSNLTLRPLEQQQALAAVKTIEEIQQKPIAEVVKNLEEEIKAELRSKYEQEVADEQRLRSQKVSEGTTQGIRRKMDKKMNKNELHKPGKAPKQKSIAEKVEEGFQEIKVSGRIKFQKLMRMGREVLKHNDAANLLQDDKQKGSHQVLHMEQGPPVTIVHPHGKKDKTVSAQSANRFLNAILKQVKKVGKPD